MARNIKDNFVDGLLQIAIFLSLIRSNLRQINTSPAITDHFDSGVTNWGQLEVSPIINTYNNDRWNSMLGVSVHPKHVENDRVEEVLRRVHSLAGFRTFERLSTRIEAFLLEEGSEAGISSSRGGLRVDAVNNQASTLNIIGEEPSKDDMELIDVLWRQDIDLGGLEDVSLMRELEKSEEMRLHNKQEEETIEQLIHSFNFSQQLNYSQPDSSSNFLNTPEIQINPQSPFQTFSTVFNHTEPPVQWHNTPLISPPPLLHSPPFLSTHQSPPPNLTSTNHTQEPHVSITTTHDALQDHSCITNISVSQETNNQETINSLVNNNNSDTLLSRSDGRNNDTTSNYTTTANITNNMIESNLDSFLHGILTDVSLSSPSEFTSQSICTTSNNSGELQLTTTLINNNHHHHDDDDLEDLMNEFQISEHFGSLEDILGMDDYTDDFLQQQQITQQPQQQIIQQQHYSQILPTSSPTSSSSPPFSFNNQDLVFMSGDDDNEYPNNNSDNKNSSNKINNNNTFSDDLLYELTDDTTFMELLTAPEQLSALTEDFNDQHDSDSALSERGEVDSKPFPVFSLPPHNDNFFGSYNDGAAGSTNHSSNHNTSIYNHDLTNSHFLSSNFSHINTTTDIATTNHNSHVVSASTTHDHNYCLPTPVTNIKRDPDAVPSCSRFKLPNYTSTNNHNNHSHADFKPPLTPLRKSNRRTIYKKESEDDDDEYIINPGGGDDDDDDDEYTGEDDDDDFLYSNKVKKSDLDFKYPIKNKKGSTSSSTTSSCRGKDDLKAMQMGIPYDVDEIIHCHAERFNEMVTSRKLTGEQVQLIKDIRKRGKNKLAAQNCRKRKLDVISALEQELEGLKEERKMSVMRRRKAMMNLQEMKQKIASLQAQIFSSLTQTPSLDGAVNGADEFVGGGEFVVVDSEQTSSSAGVFILPRDNVAFPTDATKNRRKRK